MGEFWYRCPHCGCKILIMSRDAISKGLFIKCKFCKKIVEIKVEKNNSRFHQDLRK